MKVKAKAYSTQEVAHFLRLALGSSFCWVKVLESMRNDRYDIAGLRLLPCIRLDNRIPVYALHDIKNFVRGMLARFADLAPHQPLQSVTVEYDPMIDWKLQKAKPIKASLIRGIKAAAIGLGVVGMFAGSAHAGKAEEPKTVYVGDGRWTCQGNSSQCAQVEANNRQREQQRQYESDRQRYEADRYIEENRRREQESRNRY